MTKQAMALGIVIGAGGTLIGRALRWRRAIKFAGKSIAIFGGSRGLGLVLARQLASEGARVVLVARNMEELERARRDLEQRGAAATIVQCDIRDTHQVDATIDRIVGEQGTIDVLINVAGVIQVGPAEHMTVSDFEEAMSIHFWGPLATIRAALPYMRRGGARRIVNISSIGGKIAVPHLLPYCASKFALTGLSEGLAAELAREGFRVTTVCPGLMRTGSTYNARFKGQYRREFAWFHLSASIPGMSIGARRAARQIIEACRYGDAELILTPAARLAVLLNAACPGAVAMAMRFANRVLPSADHQAGDEARTGWQSVSRRVPSLATALSDRASIENNEVPIGQASRS